MTPITLTLCFQYHARGVSAGEWTAILPDGRIASVSDTDESSTHSLARLVSVVGQHLDVDATAVADAIAWQPIDALPDRALDVRLSDRGGVFCWTTDRRLVAFDGRRDVEIEVAPATRWRPADGFRLCRCGDRFLPFDAEGSSDVACDSCAVIDVFDQIERDRKNDVGREIDLPDDPVVPPPALGALLHEPEHASPRAPTVTRTLWCARWRDDEAVWQQRWFASESEATRALMAALDGLTRGWSPRAVVEPVEVPIEPDALAAFLNDESPFG